MIISLDNKTLLSQEFDSAQPFFRSSCFPEFMVFVICVSFNNGYFLHRSVLPLWCPNHISHNMTKCQTFQEVKERHAAAGPTRKHINGLRHFFQTGFTGGSKLTADPRRHAQTLFFSPDDLSGGKPACPSGKQVFIKK